MRISVVMFFVVTSISGSDIGSAIANWHLAMQRKQHEKELVQPKGPSSDKKTKKKLYPTLEGYEIISDNHTDDENSE